MKKLFFLLFLALTGCASANIVMYHDSFQPKGDNDEIDVYDTVMPTKAYIELARISCADTDDSWNMKQIKKKAREIGADGVIVIGTIGAVASGNAHYAATREYGMKAIAIKYK